MKVNSIENQLTQIYDNATERVEGLKPAKTAGSSDIENFKNKASNPDNILSRKEKNYFKKIFPENSDRIENHVVFNRNGKVRQQAVPLGTIFDGRF